MNLYKQDNEIIASVYENIAKLGLILKKEPLTSYAVKDCLEIRSKLLGKEHSLTKKT